MKRIELTTPYQDYRNTFNDTKFLFHEFAFAVDFRSTTVFFGTHTGMFFDRRPLIFPDNSSIKPL